MRLQPSPSRGMRTPPPPPPSDTVYLLFTERNRAEPNRVVTRRSGRRPTCHPGDADRARHASRGSLPNLLLLRLTSSGTPGGLDPSVLVSDPSHSGPADHMYPSRDSWSSCRAADPFCRRTPMGPGPGLQLQGLTRPVRISGTRKHAVCLRVKHTRV